MEFYLRNFPACNDVFQFGSDEDSVCTTPLAKKQQQQTIDCSDSVSDSSNLQQHPGGDNNSCKSYCFEKSVRCIILKHINVMFARREPEQ